MNNSEKNKGYSIEEEERGVSPEKLNECIRIGSAGGLLLIAALVIAAAALIVWGFIGTIPVNITETIAVVGSEEDTDLCIAFIGEEMNTGALPVGTEVVIRMEDGKKVDGTISSMPPVLLSSEEIREMFGNAEGYSMLTPWILDKLLGQSSYSYILSVITEEDISEYWHQVGEATIIVDEIRPITLLMR